MRLAVFASGTGSNFVAIQKAIENGHLEGTIACLICDRPGALAVERAKTFGIETLVVSPREFKTKADYEAAILDFLLKKEIQLIVLAGYMRLIGPTLLKPFSSRILNIHPSLLPAFPGLHAIEKAFEAHARETGVTIHFVDEGMDTGPILAQEALEIHPDETLESLDSRVHAIEHRLYPLTIQRVIETLKVEAQTLEQNR
jgi:phosphoribosylglycinamide formyltransferase-1